MCFLLSPLDGIAALQIETQAEEGKKEKPCRWPIANVFICFQSKHTFFFFIVVILIVIIIFTHTGFSLGALFVPLITQPLPARRADARD